MADTGAPWNIPYVEPTDLVRDYPAANELMADAVAAGLTAAGNAGIGSNVVQTVKTDTFSSTASGYDEVTGLNVTITPTSAASKILVIAQVATAHSVTDQVTAVAVRRGTTRLNQSVSGDGYVPVRHPFETSLNSTIVCVDSPATTAPVTYNVATLRFSGTVFVNRTNGFTANTSSSTITVIEVAA